MKTFITRQPSQVLGQPGPVLKIIEDLYDRMFRDSHSWYHWKGFSTGMKAAEGQRFTEMVLPNGVEPIPSNHPTVTPAPKPLGIGRIGWSHFIILVGETLERSGLTESEQEELFVLLTRSKATVTDETQYPGTVGVFAAFPHDLTHREKDVLRQLALGKTNPEIADELCISINTVTRHITNIFAKTSTRNRVEAAVYAAKRQLV